MTAAALMPAKPVPSPAPRPASKHTQMDIHIFYFLLKTVIVYFTAVILCCQRILRVWQRVFSQGQYSQTRRRVIQ